MLGEAVGLDGTVVEGAVSLICAIAKSTVSLLQQGSSTDSGQVEKRPRPDGCQVHRVSCQCPLGPATQARLHMHHGTRTREGVSIVRDARYQRMREALDQPVN
jgi:hypothetical protein